MYERVHSSEIHLDPQLTPKYDQEFAHRLADTLQGKMPVYFAAIRTSMCVPFDLDYRPDLHPAGAQAIAQFAQHARQGDHALIIVYQRGYWFVISDDYIPCFAALTGLPDYLPCFVMGKPDHPLLRDLQGPIEPASFAQKIGMEAGQSDQS